MPAKSYKQLYEELKAQQAQIITEEEIFALRAVAYGCNTNRQLQSGFGDVKFLDGDTNKTVTFKEALTTVYELIKRLEGESNAKTDN